MDELARRSPVAILHAMDDLSYEELVTRLSGTDGPDDAVADLVLAAGEGPDVLRALLDGGAAPERRATAPTVPSEPARVYLTEIAVTGFRGVADRARLPFEPGPGLTLVVGRNGSGKSSFAEGLELLLTGRNLRWETKPKAWREGWRNLHAPETTRIEAAFRVDAEKEPLRVARTWPAEAPLEPYPPAQVTGPHATWEELGWDEPLERYRPLLSYNELGAMFSERASDLYTALSAVLGLEAFDATQEQLRQARLERQRTGKAERELRTTLRDTLAAAEDDRALGVLAELGKRQPDLEQVEAAIATSGGGEIDDGGLRALAGLVVPGRDTIEQVLDAAELARQEVERLERTDSERDLALAGVLDVAVTFHEAHGDDRSCPVCGTPEALDGEWVPRSRERIAALRRASSDLSDARAAAQVAEQRVTALFSPATPAVLRAADLPLEPALRAWDAWTAERRDRAAAAALGDALTAARGEAEEALLARDAAWRPLELAIVEWVAQARAAARDKVAVARLEEAEQWMKLCTAALRAERLAPVVDAARANWEQMRHESNVALGEVALAKSGNQRSVVVDVTVDGTGSSAFGVMSQGELSALAVSVFLPRAALPGTPFGFVVIDDPVQSMDPAKVDGLARVLAAAATDRQVIVFTHDERLPQAIERLQIDARIVNVKRRARSRVEVVPGSRPSERHLREAFALCKSELAPEVRGRVVPGFCRSAIEAACATRIRRRRIGAGEPHADVEAALADLTSLNTWLAEAFGLSVAQGQQITAEVRRLGGDEAVDVVRLCRSGAHEGVPGDEAIKLARGAERLVQHLEAA